MPKERKAPAAIATVERTEENRISMRLASHIACIDCHRRTMAENESAGPFNCNGCHEPSQQKLIETVKDVPRMKRNQPDYVFVKTFASDNKQSIRQPKWILYHLITWPMKNTITAAGFAIMRLYRLRAVSFPGGKQRWRRCHPRTGHASAKCRSELYRLPRIPAGPAELCWLSYFI